MFWKKICHYVSISELWLACTSNFFTVQGCDSNLNAHPLPSRKKLSGVVLENCFWYLANCICHSVRSGMLLIPFLYIMDICIMLNTYHFKENHVTQLIFGSDISIWSMSWLHSTTKMNCFHSYWLVEERNLFPI